MGEAGSSSETASATVRVWPGPTKGRSVLQVYSQSIPERVFTGRLFFGREWHRIEIEGAHSLQIPIALRTVFGVGCLVSLGAGQDTRQFWVVVEVGDLPRDDSKGLDTVKLWLTKYGVVLAIAVLAKNQPIPKTNFFSVAAPDYSIDPQREDARAFRRRCRFDVLTVITSCMNKNPPEAFCKYSTLEAADTHTRIYGRDDFMDAIQFWQEKGYVLLLNRAGDVQIKQTLDDNMMTELSGYSWNEATPAAVETARTQHGAVPMPTDYDVFVSHASEDKDAVVVPLTDELIHRGLRVWVDYKELRLGDKLRERIDDGLRRSRFGLVIVSPRFFAKQWPRTELDGLVALEMADDKKRILPIWYDVEYNEVAQWSPMLAARLATKWCEGISKVADEIMRAVSD